MAASVLLSARVRIPIQIPVASLLLFRIRNHRYNAIQFFNSYDLDTFYFLPLMKKNAKAKAAAAASA